MLGSMLFGAVVFSTLIFPRLMDIFGRKKMFILGLALHTISLFGVVFSESFDFTLGMIFIQGISMGARAQCGYVLYLELIPKRHHTFAGTYLFVIDGLTLALSSLIFSSVTNNWKHFQFYNLVISLTALGLSFKFPESPHYFYAQKLY